MTSSSRSTANYLLDTNIVIYHLNGVVGAQRLVARLGRSRSGVALSVVSYMEVLEGLFSGVPSGITRERIEAFVDALSLAPFSIREAHRCAELRAELRRSGRRVRSRSLDLIIAATALEHELTLVTNNPRDYEDIPGLLMVPANIS